MRSFTVRIILRFAVLVTGTVAILLLLGGWLLSRQTLGAIDLLNRSEFVEVRDRLGPNPGSLSPAQIDRLIRAHTEIDAALYFFQVHDLRGRTIFRSANLGLDELPDLTGGPLERTVDLADLGLVRISEFYHGPLHIEIASPVAPSYRVLWQYSQVSIFLLLGCAVASLGIGWGFAHLTLRPVRAIHDTAARIRADSLGERIPVPPGNDEWVRLVRLLNRMFDRLEASFQQVRRFTADASHELKTPLALVRLDAEKLRQKIADPDALAQVDHILEEVDRLRRITDSLLFLAKVDSGTLAPGAGKIAAEEFVEDFAADASALAEEKEVRFEVTQSEAGMVHCEPTLVRQLLLNLTTNALRVSPPGASLELSSSLRSGRWHLTLDDNGPGVPAEHLDRIFERFVQFPGSRPAHAERAGHGLGLAICRSIAQLHGGSIRAENRAEGKGLRVRVELAAEPRR